MDRIVGKFKAIGIFIAELARRSRISVKRRKAIGYIGGHGVSNLGDDVMYTALQRGVVPYKVVTFQSIRVELWLSYFGLSGKNFFKLLVLGGGTLINDMWYDKVRRSLQFGVPVISLGTGVGSCGIEQAEIVDFAAWGNVLNQFDTVTVRGNLSKGRLDSINVPSTITGDLALLLANKKLNDSYKKRIGLNLMHIPAYNKYWESIIPLLQDLREQGWEFEGLVINPKDMPYTKAYFEMIGIRHKEFDLIDSYEAFVRASEDMAFTICVRLHGSVLSLCNNVPTVLFGYRDKCEDFMSSMDLGDFYINLDKDNNNVGINDAISSLIHPARQKTIRENIFFVSNQYKEKISRLIKMKIFEN